MDADEAEIRFYVDANLLGVAKALVCVRTDVTYPAPGNPIESQDTLDVDWLPVVGDHGWLLITHDRSIRDHPAELDAFQRHGVRAVVLSPRKNLTQWGYLSLLTRHWDRIESFWGEPGPWALSLTSRGLHPLNWPGMRKPEPGAGLRPAAVAEAPAQRPPVLGRRSLTRGRRGRRHVWRHPSRRRRA